MLLNLDQVCNNTSILDILNEIVKKVAREVLQMSL